MRDVGVVIPTAGRRSGQLAAAIESVRKQTSAERIEIVVVDDSADGLDPAVLENSAGDVPLKVVRANPADPGGQRSQGVGHLSGHWVAFLDDDDEWLPSKVEEQLRVARLVEATGRQPVVSCRFWHTYDEGVRSDVTVPERIMDGGDDVANYLFRRRQASVRRASLFTSTLLTTREVCDAVQWRRLPRHQDWDWLLRLQQLGNVDVVHHELPLATIHVGSTGSISAGVNWSGSLTWARNAHEEGLLFGPAYADFLAAQAMRYALTARSAEGVKAVGAEIRRGGVTPSAGPMLVGLAGLLPREQFQRVMRHLGSRASGRSGR